eukprot:SAG31_NODE_60_length_29419_cov_39.876398_27_plen_352_part_00
MSTTTTIITHPDGTKITVATTTAATAPPPAQIKYLLSINTGRSGSDYLTELLNHADNAVSVHEGFPLMNGDVMLDYNNGNVEPMKELMQMKVSQMDAVRGEKDVYCETNHSFVKGWGWLLPELVPQEQIGVIIMTREKEAIVNSLLRLHDVPGASFFSKTWYCDPAASGNLLPAPDGTPQTHPLEHCRWYIDEIAARAAKYKQTFPGIRFFDTTLENLNRVDQVAKMFDFFGLRPKESLNAVIGVPLNQRGEWPKLKRDELVVPPKYPNPDALPTDERRKLVQSMVSYLVDERLTNEIAELKEPDNAYVSGTLMQAAQTIVTPLLRELEERFKYVDTPSMSGLADRIESEF